MITPLSKQELIIRTPLPSDIPGVLEVIKQCQPSLTVHNSYVFWMEIHNFPETCVVAERDGNIVVWCSILRVAHDRLFLHQLGVSPSCRGQKIPELMVKRVLGDFRCKFSLFEMQFTVDRRNKALLRIFRSMLRDLKLEIVKSVCVTDLVEPDSQEELYSLTTIPFQRSHSPGGPR